MKILVLNSDSSSEKACRYEIRETVPDHFSIPLWQGNIEWSSNSLILAGKTLLRGVSAQVALQSEDGSLSWKGKYLAER